MGRQHTAKHIFVCGRDDRSKAWWAPSPEARICQISQVAGAYLDEIYDEIYRERRADRIATFGRMARGTALPISTPSIRLAISSCRTASVVIPWHLSAMSVRLMPDF
jgi:hypothetical protein